MKRLALCIATYLRPQGLTDLLQGVLAQRFERIARPEIDLIVVDNDEKGSARTICERVSNEAGVRINYLIQPARGIPQVRNTAVRLAMSLGVEALAFIDDDEVPEPDWLERLISAQAAYGADLVHGPVVPVFEKEPPRWLASGRFFDRPRSPTGTPRKAAATHNLLVRAEVFRALGGFDESWGLTGCDDTFFALQAKARGFSIVWCDEAVVRETVPLKRMNARWLMQRAFRGGNMTTLIELKLRPSPLTLADNLARGVGNLGLGLLAAPVRLAGGRHRALRSLIQASCGVGQLWGVLGRRYEEYR